MMASQFAAETDAELLRKKQLCLTQDSKMGPTQPDICNNNNNNDDDPDYNNQQSKDDFFDTGFQQEQHRRHRQTPVAKIAAEQDEPLVVYSDENSSITRTVRDQFAVALLKLQKDLEATGRRLSDLESAISDSTSAKGTTRSQAPSRPSSGGKWQSGHMIQILYIGWPMIVYIAMRYMERRSLASKLTQ